MPIHLDGANVVITGAARGIGRAIAARFVAEGARVVVNDIDAEALADTAAAIGAIAAPGDAASEVGVAALLAHARAELGAIDIFCANAGIEAGGRGEGTEQEWARTWDVNVMAHVRAFEQLAPEWLDRGRGRFIATVSAAGLLTMPGAAAYSATKHAALAHAEWLSMTYGGRGITVQAVCPLGVRTDRYTLANFYESNEWELFDREKDPQELKSVYADPAYAKTVAQLKTELTRLRVQYQDSDDIKPAVRGPNQNPNGKKKKS